MLWVSYSNFIEPVQLMQYPCVMWYLLFEQDWFRCFFSHRLWFFQMYSTFEEEAVTNALSSQSPIKAEEWGTSLHCHAHRTPLSVRQSCSPNKCPHPAVLHRRCREKVSDYLTSKMRHLHQIINTLTDRRQHVLGEHFSTASTTEARPTFPLHECFYPGICSLFNFSANSKGTSQQQKLFMGL